MQDSFQAQPVIPAKRANGWKTISRAEDVCPNLDLKGVSQCQVVGERFGVSADRRFGVDWWHFAVLHSWHLRGGGANCSGRLFHNLYLFWYRILLDFPG
jgi:hypothetical protein